MELNLVQDQRKNNSNAVLRLFKEQVVSSVLMALSPAQGQGQRRRQQLEDRATAASRKDSQGKLYRPGTTRLFPNATPRRLPVIRCHVSSGSPRAFCDVCCCSLVAKHKSASLSILDSNLRSLLLLFSTHSLYLDSTRPFPWSATPTLPAALCTHTSTLSLSLRLHSSLSTPFPRTLPLFHFATLHSFRFFIFASYHTCQLVVFLRLFLHPFRYQPLSLLS